MQQEHEHVDAVVELIRILSKNNDDVKMYYKHYLIKEGAFMTPAVKLYFKKQIFDNIPYEVTKSKMVQLMKHNISKVTFEGKEIN